MAVASVAVLVGTAFVLDRRSADRTPPAPDRLPAAVGPLEVGDQRTADLCAILDAGALSGFGEAVPDPTAGRLNSCTVSLGQPGQARIAVALAVDPPSSEPPDGVQQRLGDTVIIRRPGSDTGCLRVLWLSDGTRMMFTANYNGSGSPTVDLCAVAETVTATAARGLAERGVPRRGTPGGPGTLWSVDACGLLEQPDLAPLPTVPLDPYPGFGRWDCQYGDDADPETAIQLAFSRSSPPSGADDLTAVPGRSATIYTELDDGLCYAYVEHRPSEPDVDGDPLVETVRVRVTAPLDDEALCTAAASLADAASLRLPPPT